jgi:multidrug efflux pump subunit AcrA (membrane-fusion protein)
LQLPTEDRYLQTLVEIGQDVRAGDPLVRLETRELQLALERAESALCCSASEARSAVQRVSRACSSSAPRCMVISEVIHLGHEGEHTVFERCEAFAQVLTILAQASLSITSFTWKTGNGTYVAGTSFTIHITLYNPATSARAESVITALDFGARRAFPQTRRQ